jgi:multiple antibiotic resistance protein
LSHRHVISAIGKSPEAWAALIVAAVLWPSPARAEPMVAIGSSSVEVRQMFALLFLMLGPIKVLVPFMNMTQGTAPEFRRRLATRAILYSAAALGLAGLIGQNTLDNFAVPVPVLALTGGLVLFLVALQTVLQQFQGPMGRTADGPPPTLQLAFSPLAFPTIVTPYGIAATIIFVTLANDIPSKLVVGGLLLAILALDWVAMIFAHVVIRYFGTALQVFAVVLGVTQIAIGLMVILRSLSQLGVFVLRVP